MRAVVTLALLLAARHGASAERFVLVSFHTLGPPHDNGTDLSSAGEAFVASLTPVCDAIYKYDPHILSVDRWWCDHFQSYPEEARYQLLPYNPRAEKIGYWKYKALVLCARALRGCDER